MHLPYVQIVPLSSATMRNEIMHKQKALILKIHAQQVATKATVVHVQWQTLSKHTSWCTQEPTSILRSGTGSLACPDLHAKCSNLRQPHDQMSNSAGILLTDGADCLVGQPRIQAGFVKVVLAGEPAEHRAW